MYQYILCGLKVESDLAFPELTPWEGVAEGPFDIEFRLGKVAQLWDPDEKGVKFRASGPDQIIFHIEKVGRIMIENGRRVVFDAVPGLDDTRLRVEFLGTTQSMLWYQRGYLPLHASALLIGDRAVAVGAQSHSGKSVIAAALSKRGHPVVADDMMVLDCSGKVPLILPGYQKLRLWKDACEQLDLMGAVIAKALPTSEKFVLATAGAAADRPVPLTDMFILSGLRQTTFDAERLGPVQGLRYLLAAMHWFDAARTLGRQQQVFSGINAVVSNVRIWRATAPEGLAHAGASADAILEISSSARKLAS